MINVIFLPSAKSNSQSDNPRERRYCEQRTKERNPVIDSKCIICNHVHFGLWFRRPEITIVSAEPLASNNWFPGTTVVFHPPPPQSGWSAGIQAVSQVAFV